MLNTLKHNYKTTILALGFGILFGSCVHAQTDVGTSSAITVEELAVPAASQPVTVESNQRIKNQSPLGSPQVIQETVPQTASLSFAWNMPVNLAVFKRENKLWIVFDHSQKIDIEEIRKAAGPLAKNIFQFPHPSATIIQLTPVPDAKVSVRKEGLLWIIDLFTNEQPAKEVKDMVVYTQFDSLKRPYLFIPTENSGNIVPVIDPDVGDIISIAPTSDMGFGTSQPYRYPEFDMLSTSQGMAFVIKAPDILLNRGNTGLTLRAHDRGLNITSNLDSIKRQELFKLNGDTLQSFDLQVDPKLLNLDYNTATNQLRQEILAAEPELKNKARLEMVKYYLAKGLGTNALYILNQMKKAEIPESFSDKFHAMLGVANFLTKRYDEAIENFEHGTLPEIGEAIFWRTLAQSAKEYRRENNVVLFSYVSLIRDYPQELRDQIAVIGAKASLQSNDDLAAQNFIDLLKTEDERLKDRSAQIAYLSAKKTELLGYPRNAIKEYRWVATFRDEKYSALARFDNVVLSQQINVMPVKKAIAELEQLRFAWSEPSFKLKVLNKLAQMYIKDSDYYNALRIMQETLPLTNEEQKKALTERMVSVFEDIYINNQADGKMTAVKSLAMYRDFEWLGKLSSHYNQIVQKLADRLVAVDLLPRAEKLLEELLKKGRLTKEDRAKIGARLAVIYLFEERSPDALQILIDTDDSSLPQDIKAHRRVIEARALANIEKIDEALALLEDDNSRNATLLKTEIFWNGRQWDKVSDTIKYLVEKPTPGKPLSIEQIGYILDWATALKKSGRETVLVRLRNKFMPYFEKTQYRGAFNILTNHLEPDTVDLKQINNIVNDVQNFSNFAKAYNESLKKTDTE